MVTLPTRVAEHNSTHRDELLSRYSDRIVVNRHTNQGSVSQHKDDGKSVGSTPAVPQG